jgi:hypothetical protein
MVHMLLGHARVDENHEDLVPFFTDLVRHVDAFLPIISSILVQNVRVGALDAERVKDTIATLLKRDIIMSNVTSAGLPYSEPALVMFIGKSAEATNETFLRLCSASTPTVDFKAFLFNKKDPFLRGEDSILRRRRRPMKADADLVPVAAEPPASQKRKSMTRATSVGLLPSEFTKPDELGMKNTYLAVLPADRRDKVETHLCVLKKYMESSDCQHAVVDTSMGFSKRYNTTTLKASSCPWISKSSSMVLGMSKQLKSKKPGGIKFKARFLHRQEVLGFKGYPHGSANLALLSERSANAVVGTAPPLPVVASAFYACLAGVVVEAAEPPHGARPLWSPPHSHARRPITGVTWR